MKFRNLLLSAALLAPLSAQAVVLNVDTAVNTHLHSESGYELEAFRAITYNDGKADVNFTKNVNRANYFNSGKEYLTVNWTSPIATIKHEADALFDLNAIELGGGASSEYVTVTVTGLDSLGSIVVSQTFANQNALTNHTFTEFTGLSSVELTGNKRISFDNIDVTEANVAPKLSCAGFDAPMENGPVKVKKNRVLPLKAQILDAEGFVVGDQDIAAAPVLTVLYSSSADVEAVDVSDEALSSGQGSEGNLFSYDAETEQWQFNLKTKNYTASGTYSVSLTSGDASEYGVDATCGGSFVIK